MFIKKNKQVLITSLFLISILSSCSHAPAWSSRDITAVEKQDIQSYPWSTEREPADWIDKCTNGIRNFFTWNKATANAANQAPLPELTQLNPELKKFPNGKKYTEYKANINVMNNYPDYDEYLAQTAEIIFEPVEPFGHINLRIGKKIYSFNFIQSTSINKFVPRIKNSSNPELSGSVGYVFQMNKEQITAMEKEVEAFYKTSASNNIPPFDAYSPLLKIYEKDGAFGGKSLFFKSTSPKFGNMNAIKGSIVEEDGKYFLDAGNGVKVPVIKDGDDYLTQSYSCSSSAGRVMEKFFGVEISYDQSAKSLQQSLANGNMNSQISPIGVIKYYEEQ